MALTSSASTPSATALPTRAEWQAFIAQGLQAAGVGAIGAGLLFFVAANWQAWGLMGRFGVLQAVVVLAAALALWRPPPQPLGPVALLLGLVAIGANLAFVGQAYQTGADVAQLFYLWAALALPWAWAAQSGAGWALWWTVLNVGLWLSFHDGTVAAWLQAQGLVSGESDVAALWLPCAVDLLGAGVFLALRHSRHRAAAPLWLLYALLAVALLCGTLAASASERAAPTLVLALVTSAVVAVTVRARRDIVPLALMAASWIAVGAVWTTRWLSEGDFVPLLWVAAWLVLSSTVAAQVLLRCHRRWRAGVPMSSVRSTRSTPTKEPLQ